jgi:hypothetical protein
MQISKSQILDIIHQNLSAEHIEGSFIYWDSKIRIREEQIQIGPQTYQFEFDSILIFVDLAPFFNWAHPCLYLFLNIDNLEVETVDASFPPYSNHIPETYSILLKYGIEQLPLKESGD